MAQRQSALGQSIPRLVTRPGVFGTPRDFWRDTGYCLATRGEYIWWIVDRDDEGLARGLLLLPPGEVVVTWNENLNLVREYKWRNKDIPADDIEHGFFVREPGGLRGFGPLQMCGAAVSVAVEADEWASRFFGRGGVPSVVLQTAANLSAEDSDRLVTRWLERQSNEAVSPQVDWKCRTTRPIRNRHSCWNRVSTRQRPLQLHLAWTLTCSMPQSVGAH